LYIITFYSFKGGVGRTMALVNTAAELARRGRKVLLVDFDLEAPGLSTYELLRSPEPQRGIVEYVSEYRRTRRSPLVTDFISPARTVGKKGGQIWVMPAGRGDAEYRRQLNALNWRALYQDEEGFLLFEDTRLQWEAELHPDYVLIDARTGHTDIEGICTRQLADAVVLVFHPNEQNLVGLREVCRDIRAERTSGLKKEITLHFVAANVPDLEDERGLLHRRLDQFRCELANHYTPITIIHRKETLRMLDQPIFVLERPRSRLAHEYRFLVDTLQIENPKSPEGALLFLREIQKEKSRLINWSKYDWQRLQQSQAHHQNDEENPVSRPRRVVPDLIRSRIRKLTENFLNHSEIFLRIGEYFSRHGEWELGLSYYDRVLKLQPNCAEALFQRGLCRHQLRDDTGAAQDLLGYLHQIREEREQSFPDLPYGIPPSPANLPFSGHRALLELLSISIEDFAKALEIPLIAACGAWYWLHMPVHHLVHQHRWNEAIRYLETTVKDRIKSEPIDFASADTAFQAFFLAMAHWGAADQPSMDLCSKALALRESILAKYEIEEIDPLDFQEMALLMWGIGDIAGASRAIDEAINSLERTGEILDGISYWTFAETTPTEFRKDCEQMRRMIRGEPVRPSFLGPSREANPG
jgi:MinD-like ATPase involved in chromosome partitioning or flagellar assembly